MLSKVFYSFLKITTEKWAFISWKCKAGMKDAFCLILKTAGENHDGSV